MCIAGKGGGPCHPCVSQVRGGEVVAHACVSQVMGGEGYVCRRL